MKSLQRRLRFFSSYFSKPLWDSNESPPELIEFLRNNKAGIALDLGCGTGTNLLTLSKFGWDVEGVDYILFAVLKARRKVKLQKANAAVYHHDILDLSFLNRQYDLILDIGCYHSLEYEQKLTYESNLRNYLKPNGYYLLYGFNQTKGPRIGIKDEDLLRFNGEFNRTKDIKGIGINERPSRWILFQKNFHPKT